MADLVWDIFLAAVAALTQLAAALLGWHVTVKRPNSKQKVGLGGAFLLCGVFGVGATIAISIRSSMAQRQINDLITGGTNYPYLTVGYYPNPQNKKLLLFGIHNPGDVPVRDVQIAISPGESPTPKQPGYASIGQGLWASIPPHATFPVAAGPIEIDRPYHVDITALNGTVFQETIITKRADGHLVQRIEVRGAKISPFQKSLDLGE